MTIAYHVSSRQALPGIQAEGLKEVSYWTTDERVCEYYAETIADEGLSPLVLRLPLEVLSMHQPEPDHPGLEEPLTYTLGMKEEEVWDAWDESEKTWQACEELIGSLRCRAPIAVEILRQFNPDLFPLPAVSSRPRP